MFKLIYLSCCLAFCSAAQSALPPQYQNAKDIDVMLNYAKAHERVMMYLQRIDVEHSRIEYAGDCVVQFEREKPYRPKGWAGPAGDLRIASTHCSE